MAITLYCPACGTRFGVEESALGETVSCTGCGRVFPLPARGGAAPEQPAHTRAYYQAHEAAAQEDPGAGQEVLGALADLASAAAAAEVSRVQGSGFSEVGRSTFNVERSTLNVEHRDPRDASPPTPNTSAGIKAPMPTAMTEERRKIGQAAIFLIAGGGLALMLVIFGVAKILSGGRGDGDGARSDQSATTQATQQAVGEKETNSQALAPLVPNPRPGNHFVLPVEVLREVSIGEFRAIVYPAGAGAIMGVFREDPSGKQVIVERWTINPWNKTGEARFEAEEIDTGGQFKTSLSNVSLVFRHGISTKGSYFARLAHSRIDVWSFEAGKVVHSIELEGRDTAVQVLGFYDDVNLATLWFRGAEASVEIYSAASGKRVHKIELPRSRRMGGNYSVRNIAFGGGGKAMGVGTDDGRLMIVDLATGKVQKELKIPTRVEAQGAAHPAQVVFSPDGTQLAVLYDKAGEPSIATGRVDGMALEEVRWQEIDTPYTLGQAHAGRTIDFLDDNRRLLVYGQVMVDVAERQIVGQLESVPAVRLGRHTISQRRIGEGMFQMEMAEGPQAQAPAPGAGGNSVRRMLRVAKLEGEGRRGEDGR